MRICEVYEDDELENGQDEDLKAYLRLVNRQLRVYVENYFKGKTFHCGGNIPIRQLMDDDVINFVRRMTLAAGVSLAHELLEEHRAEEGENWAIKTVTKLVKECHKFGIPHEYQSGLVLLYLKLCLGVPVPSIEDCYKYQYKFAFENPIEETPNNECEET